MYIYQKAFGQFDFGYASAMSLALFVILIIITFVQMRLLRAERIGQRLMSTVAGTPARPAVSRRRRFSVGRGIGVGLPGRRRADHTVPVLLDAAHPRSRTTSR